MPQTLRPSRIAAALLFLLYGTLIGTWTARIPAVKQHLGLSDGRLSIALVGLALGAVTGMQLSGRLVDRYGSRRIMIPAALVDGCFLLPVAVAPSLVTLTSALFAFGVVHGVLNIAMNARGVEIERAAERPIMSSFHAVYSIGGFLGAVLGGVTAAAGASPLGTFAVVAVLGAALALWSRRWSAALTETAGSPADGPARQVPLSGVLLLGTLALCALVGEGAAADWSTVYLRDSLHSTEGFAAAAFAAFFIAMTAGRLTGDRLSERLGPVALARRGGLLASVAMAISLAAGIPAVGLVAYVALGAGLSVITPMIFRAAATGGDSGPALAAVTTTGYLGLLSGPPIIGAVASVTSVPTSLLLVIVATGAVTLGAGALRPPRAAVTLSADSAAEAA